jgi:hypothetical protein
MSCEEDARMESVEWTESQYWVERNALVDAAKALTPSGPRAFVAFDERTPEEHEEWARYGAALDALKAFDEAHGGTPIL